MFEPVIPKFIPAPGGFVLNPARRAAAEARLRGYVPNLSAPAEGLLDRIMREHFARTVR